MTRPSSASVEAPKRQLPSLKEIQEREPCFSSAERFLHSLTLAGRSLELEFVCEQKKLTNIPTYDIHNEDTQLLGDVMTQEYRQQYTRRQRFVWFLEYWVPMVLRFLPSYALLLGALTFTYFDIIPAWIASPLAIVGWCRANYHYWSYQAWRASGPRGRIVNPFGPSGGDVQTTLLWLLFGVFFHVYHVWLRSSLAYRLCTRTSL